MSSYNQTRDAAGKVTTQYGQMLQNLEDDLVKRLRSSTQFYHADCELKMACADRIEELEAKLAKAGQMLEREIRRVQKLQRDFPPPHTVRLISVEEEYKLMLSELKGQ